MVRRLIFLFWCAGTTLALFSPDERVREVRDDVRTVRGLPVEADEDVVQRKPWEADAAWNRALVFGLALLGIRQWPREKRRARVWRLLAILTAFSITSELIQEYGIPGRAFEWGDLLVNQLGIVLGLALGRSGSSG